MLSSLLLILIAIYMAFSLFLTPSLSLLYYLTSVFDIDSMIQSRFLFFSLTNVTSNNDPNESCFKSLYSKMTRVFTQLLPESINWLSPVQMYLFFDYRVDKNDSHLSSCFIPLLHVSQVNELEKKFLSIRPYLIDKFSHSALPIKQAFKDWKQWYYGNDI